ncbi:cytochrome P450 736A117-like [Impatiens glandulifera]|uniref:cytochrome P450 736A117-like n=1 Tax=Impatiens glandulifera TaxID=253017 RepID=UPI001FB0A37A|nr:cytochrome P450 736A117-like [Impatiens glandulifera]
MEDSSSIQILSLFILFLSPLLLLKCFLSSQTNKNKINPPPSPRKIPIIGHLHCFAKDPHRSLLSLSRRHGPIMLLHLGSSPAVVISSAAAAKEIMKTHDLIFSNRPVFKVNRKLLYDLKDVSVSPYGEYWRQLKSICVLQLLSNHKVKSFRSVREEEVLLMIEKIEESRGKNIQVNLSEMFSKLANDIVCRASFGRKYDEGEKGRRFRRLLKEFLVVLGTVNAGDFLPWLSWINKLNGWDNRVDRVAKEMDDFLEEVVEEKMNQRKFEEIVDEDDDERKEGFVDILLRIHMSQETGVSIDRDSVKAIILDIFSAGTDTTSTILEWAMTELLRHPKAMKELQNEVRKVANGKSIVTEDDIENMSYLKAVIKETLRYHTPIPLLVPREATQDVKVMGYDIAVGTIVFINGWAIGRDPVSWDDPEEFKPDRFLNSSIDYRGRDFELIPFGAGRRGCPGISFGIATNELALANIVNKFNWELPNRMKGEDLDVDECIGVTIHRKNPLVALAM